MGMATASNAQHADEARDGTRDLLRAWEAAMAVEVIDLQKARSQARIDAYEAKAHRLRAAYDGFGRALSAIGMGHLTQVIVYGPGGLVENDRSRHGIRQWGKREQPRKPSDYRRQMGQAVQQALRESRTDWDALGPEPSRRWPDGQRAGASVSVPNPHTGQRGGSRGDRAIIEDAARRAFEGGDGHHGRWDVHPVTGRQFQPRREAARAVGKTWETITTNPAQYGLDGSNWRQMTDLWCTLVAARSGHCEGNENYCDARYSQCMPRRVRVSAYAFLDAFKRERLEACRVADVCPAPGMGSAALERLAPDLAAVCSGSGNNTLYWRPQAKNHLVPRCPQPLDMHALEQSQSPTGDPAYLSEVGEHRMYLKRMEAWSRDARSEAAELDRRISRVEEVGGDEGKCLAGVLRGCRQQFPQGCNGDSAGCPSFMDATPWAWSTQTLAQAPACVVRGLDSRPCAKLSRGE